MVEVFRTSVRRKADGKALIGLLKENFPSLRINFDLADIDRVLRIEGDRPDAAAITKLLRERGFECEVLT